MPDIDRAAVREKLSSILQNEYVALLGQRDTDLGAVVRACVEKRPPLNGMKFVSIALPRIASKKGFEDTFLRRLLSGAAHIPPASLATDVMVAVQQAVDEPGVRIRAALDTLGRETSLNYLVIILHALADIPEDPLKDLLQMLREYYGQKGNKSEPGDKLRFLVVGGERLWKLCYHKIVHLSPFNIAQRLLLDGFSVEELRMIASHSDLDTIIQLHNMTGGVPALVNEFIQAPRETNDLSPYFAHLQDPWNVLSQEARDGLIYVAESPYQLPQCDPDYKCPQIPVIRPPHEAFQEAFWAGFLRMKYRQLAWRSQIHRAFVLKQANTQNLPSISTLARLDLEDRTQRLAKALSDADRGNKHEPLIEAQSLVVETYNDELKPILEMACQSGRSDTVLRKVEQLTALSERDWLKELARGAAQHKDTLNTFLLEAVVARANYFLSAQFDVFLCYNDNDNGDITDVRAIAIQLKERLIVPWLDEWEVPPGRPWQRLIEQQIAQIKSAAVFVGKNGVGPWQREQIESLLRQFVDRGCSVIPVLLANAPEQVQLPLFLGNRKWVDFRKHDPDPLQELIRGVTGKRQ